MAFDFWVDSLGAGTYQARLQMTRPRQEERHTNTQKRPGRAWGLVVAGTLGRSVAGRGQVMDGLC